MPIAIYFDGFQIPRLMLALSIGLTESAAGCPE